MDEKTREAMDFLGVAVKRAVEWSPSGEEGRKAYSEALAHLQAMAEENERRKESSNALIKRWREIAEKAEAELARWKPLIEAAEKAEMQELIWAAEEATWLSSAQILTAALSCRESPESDDPQGKGKP